MTTLNHRLVSLLRTLGGVALIAGLGACASGPDAARFERPMLQTFPVDIVAVDGAPVAGATSTLMEPGLRRVTVRLPRSLAVTDGEQRTIELAVKACTRYWLVASRDIKAPDAAVDVRVDHEQTVPACLARRAS